MTITERRLLLAAFILIFSVLSPLIILYASGYRYNTRLGKIEQVGLLSLSTVQTDTTAFVGGQSFPVKKDLLLSTLQPREYEITLTKEGYKPWVKQLSIEEGRTTFASNVRLFPDTEAQPAELFTNPLVLLAENDSVALYRGVAGLVAYDKASKGLKEVDAPVAGLEPRDAFLFENKLFAFKQAGSWFLMQLEDMSIAALETPQDTHAVFPAASVSYALTAKGVYELSDGEATPLFDIDEPQAILPDGKAFWVISSEATHKRSFLYLLSDANARPQFIATFPYSSGWNISENTGGLLTIHDAGNQNLYFVDTKSAPAAIVTVQGVHDWHWSADHRSVLTAAAHELSVFHVHNGTNQELIVRQSEPIIDAAWGPDESWVLFSTKTGIYAAERDTRGGRNILELTAKKTNPHVLEVSKDEAVFTSQEGNAFVFWKFPFEREL